VHVDRKPTNHCKNDYAAELQKALNRVDFFRIFHAMAIRHRFDHFCVLQVFSDRAISSLAGHLILDDLPLGLADAYDKRYKFTDSALLKSIQGSTLPSLWTDMGEKGDVSDEFVHQLGFDIAISIPVQGFNGGRYCFVFFGDREEPDTAEMNQIYFDTCYAFDFFYGKVLTSKKGMGLTARETEILRWISYGKTAGEIAMIVSVSEHTVNSHTATILKKLDVVNRTQMVAKAIREQIIE